MGIKPVSQRQPDFPTRILGYAQSAFFGGRTSAHIRKIPVPVVYTDFLSMYPTVNSLMNLWGFVTARKIVIDEECTREIQGFLDGVRAADLFDRFTWKTLTAFVKVVPDGDILPTRGKYSAQSNDWQIGVNCLYADDGQVARNALWFSLPDVVASVILTGRVPKIAEAFRIVPVGCQSGLNPTRLRGTIAVDPGEQDFFKVAIEERKRLAHRKDVGQAEQKILDKALKVLANATSYGIYAEMNRQESDEPVSVVCNGLDAQPFICRVSHPDVPGEYCFPPLASLITGAARLMLALLEHSVNELGGTYAMEDTDSMAIVATETGGLIPCPGGTHKADDDRESVKALAWKQVDDIAQRFAALNPYAPDAVSGSVLKIEDHNFDFHTGQQRQLYCYAISAKRYVLFIRNETGEPELLREGINNKDDKWSEHGLGHLLNPIDPLSTDRKWVAEVWLNTIRRAEGFRAEPLRFVDTPAVGRVTISSPAVMKSFREFNENRLYADQIKPFNFILTCQVRAMGHPTGVDPEHFHLIAPYASDSRQWLKIPWIDQYTGTLYRIKTTGDHGDRKTARVKTYRDVLREYEFHPESKCADANGNVCDRQTVGLLQRRHVRIEQIKYIGKESNSIEDVESGMIASPDAVYTEYPNPRCDEWQTVILPVLKKMALADLVAQSGLSRRTLIDLRAGRSRPHPNNGKILARIISGQSECQPGCLN
jgi:hypothetical protein